MAYPYIITGSSIAVTVNGRTINVQSDAPNYEPLKRALKAGDRSEVEKYLDLKGTIEAWSKGNFRFGETQVFYKDEPVPSQLGDRILSMAAKGEDPSSLMKFWEKLQRNPSWRSVEQLFPFLKHEGIPIQPNGNFLAYKGVKSNYTDKHTGLVDNKPGAVCEMPRNKISDDPKEACHYGFHVGALQYAREFASVVVVCEVDPADVVCIPYDAGQQKMRVCRYKVVGNHNGELLPSTSYELESGLGQGAEIQPEQEELDLDIEENEPEESENTREGKRELKELADAIGNLEKNAKPLRAPKTKKPPKEKRLKKQRPEDKLPELKVKAQFRKIHAMDRRALLDESIMDLRTYAGQVLHIVGASKIPGGKVPLINQILKVRKSFR